MSDDFCIVCGHVPEGHDAYHDQWGDRHPYVSKDSIGGKEAVMSPVSQRMPAETEALRRFSPTIPFCEQRRADFVAGWMAGADAERDHYQDLVAGLLARIHRDGGQSVSNLGFAGAVAKAEEQVIEWLMLDDDAEAIYKQMASAPPPDADGEGGES